MHLQTPDQTILQEGKAHLEVTDFPSRKSKNIRLLEAKIRRVFHRRGFYLHARVVQATAVLSVDSAQSEAKRVVVKNETEPAPVQK